jgi:2-polyprenyl-3-methyl-5-hydroxy-6-metoxy-1,4-benzoquinol methylase
VYTTKGEQEVSWYQARPEVSLELIASASSARHASVIDIGGGASRLPDTLLEAGFADVTVLDVSEAALATSRARLGSAASRINWIAADVTMWEPTRQFDVWHDRAVLHFLTDPADRAAYVETLLKALRLEGTAIIGTFALDGPEKCSGLPVVRYDAAKLAQLLGASFTLVATKPHEHVTPWKSTQRFQFSVFRRT